MISELLLKDIMSIHKNGKTMISVINAIST